VKGAARRPEQGAAAVFGMAMIGLVAVVAMVAVGIGALILAHRRAQSAADLAALAAAVGQQRGAAPCRAAERVAVANGARLVGCVLNGDVATVDVECAALVGGIARMPGQARAGPAGLE